MTEQIQFNDPESGAEIIGEVVSKRYVGEQRWFDVRVEGISWAVPVGWPNASSPVCQESEPEAYAGIFG